MTEAAARTISDWLGYPPPPPEDPPESLTIAPQDPEQPTQRVRLTPASQIRPRRVRWLWEGRIAYGTLALLAGREGLGKSTLGYHIAAQVTRGTLDGEDHGRPRSVLVAAAEDSWEHTIVPRLIAADADLDRVFRIDVITGDEMTLGIRLPRDFLEVEEQANLVDAGLLILDPLMSVIDGRLDTHRDREVRTALEPLASLADRCRMGILGLIHHNKSGSTDALQLVMGSKAFAAVARSVHTCIPDPDDDTQERRLFATSKNNLGRLDLPVLGFTITSHAVETEDDGVAWTGRLVWTGEVQGSIHEIMSRSADPERGATDEATMWLRDYLTSQGGSATRKDIDKAARTEGHSMRTLQRVGRERLRIVLSSDGFPRRTYWSLPEADPNADSQSRHSRANVGATGATGSDLRKDGSSSMIDGTSASVNSPVAPNSHFTSSQQSRQAPGATAPVAPVAPNSAPLGATGSDLHKRENSPRARTRARETPPLARLEDGATVEAPVAPVAPNFSAPPRARARENAPPLAADWQGPIPTCPDCDYPVDSTGHATICDT